MWIEREFDFNSEEQKKFDEYIENKMKNKIQPSKDEDFLFTWNLWINEATDNSGFADVLNAHISSKRPVNFKQPECVKIEIYESIAGKIPIIVIGNDDDFEQFIVNVAYRGVRPDNIHQQGASFLSGKNNRFIVLSEKPYSNIPAKWMNLSDNEWRKKSMVLRRAHECTHYYTRRYYGTAANNLHDELMADFFGLYAAFKEYKAKWFLHFMGVDGENRDGRLSLYVKDLPTKVAEAIGKTAVHCAKFLEKWSLSKEFIEMSDSERVDFLCELGIAGMVEKSK